MMRRLLVTGCAVCAAVLVLAAQGPIMPLAQVPARSDSNASLMVSAAAFSGIQGPIQPLATVNGRSDSSGSLLVTLASGTATPDKLCLDATNRDACLQRNGAGILQLGNAATSTDFNRLQFGGSTSSFPAIAKTGSQQLTVSAADNAATLYDLQLRNVNFSSTSNVVWASRGSMNASADGVFAWKNAAATTTATLTVPTGTANVVPVTVALGRATAQTAANASVSTFTVGAADATFEVSANVLVTTATTHTFTVECAYTDEGNTARTLTMPFTLVAGSAIVTSIANGNGAVPYMGIVQHIRAKAATAITIRTQAAGTYTTVTYNVEGVIKKTT